MEHDGRGHIRMKNNLLQPAYGRLRGHQNKLRQASLTSFVPLLLFMFVITATANAQEQSGDVSAGRQLAQAECSACHDGRGNMPAGRRAPSLSAVAAMPSTTSMSLRVFLRTPHANMPNYHLSEQEIDDIVAYILSLRR